MGVVDAGTGHTAAGAAAVVDTDTDAGAYTHTCGHSMGTGADSGACLDKGADEAGTDTNAERHRQRCSGRCRNRCRWMQTDRQYRVQQTRMQERADRIAVANAAGDEVTGADTNADRCR